MVVGRVMFTRVALRLSECVAVHKCDAGDVQCDRICAMRVVIGFFLCAFRMLCVLGVFSAAICWYVEEMMMLVNLHVRLSKFNNAGDLCGSKDRTGEPRDSRRDL